MTKLVFDKRHFFDCSKVTRDIAPSFHLAVDGQEYSLALKGQGAEESRICLYSGKYNGLNRALCSFEIEGSAEDLLRTIVSEDRYIEVIFGDAQDYFGLKRIKDIKIGEYANESLEATQAG